MVDLDSLTIGEAKNLMVQLNSMFPPNVKVNIKTCQASLDGVTGRAVVVFANNAIIFGYTSARSTGDVTLTNARNCYYYAKQDSDEKLGFLGLAEYGPAKGSKVGATAKKIIVNACCIQDCSDSAVNIWESSKWG